MKFIFYTQSEKLLKDIITQNLGENYLSSNSLEDGFKDIVNNHSYNDGNGLVAYHNDGRVLVWSIDNDIVHLGVYGLWGV